MRVLVEVAAVVAAAALGALVVPTDMFGEIVAGLLAIPIFKGLEHLHRWWLR